MALNLSLNNTPEILDAARTASLTVQQTAYVLATAFWETNRTMMPVEEAYYLGSKADAYRKKLRYYPWHGRGFVQLTWRNNYVRAGEELGIDLTTDPTVAMRPDVAAKILVIGSQEGWFTGKSLSTYIHSKKCDYVNARRIINGTDCAEQIAAIAAEYEAAFMPEPAYPNIRIGSSGAAVVVAQTKLKIKADGFFGNQTRNAVIAWQRVNGLVADGIIGPASWAKLLEE